MAKQAGRFRTMRSVPGALGDVVRHRGTCSAPEPMHLSSLENLTTAAKDDSGGVRERSCWVKIENTNQARLDPAPRYDEGMNREGGEVPSITGVDVVPRKRQRLRTSAYVMHVMLRESHKSRRPAGTDVVAVGVGRLWETV